MPTETITITVTGANPQTKTVTVNVNPLTGNGATSVNFTGVNGGQDTFVATSTINGSNYTSNSAFVAWQPTNGTTSLVSNLIIAGYTNPGETATWHGAGTLYSTLASKNTVVVNQVYTNGAAGTGVPITGLTTNDGNTGQYAHVPPLLDDVKSDGTALTPLGSVLGWGLGAAGDGSFVTFFQGQIVVAQAGIQTFYLLVDDSWALYIGGGATYVAGAFITAPNGTSPSSPSTASAAVTGTSLSGVGAWPLIGTRNTAAQNVQPTDYVYVNFPEAGIYPFLAWWVNAASAQTYFQMTYASGSAAIPPSSGNGLSGGVIKPVALQAAPPATSPAGNLQLSLGQSNIEIQGNQITINVNVTGITFTTETYIPLLEGVAGKLFIYNNPGNSFNFQTYNGQPVDKPSALSAVFTLNGNTQSLVSVAYNNASDGQYSLIYPGTAFPAGIASSTTLTVTAEDIAWFDSSNKSYDTFTPASVGGPGGISSTILVNYLVVPTGYTVSPPSVPADGENHVFTFTLSQPLSPVQIGAGGITPNTVTPSFSATGGASIGTVTSVFNTSGFLTGYTVAIIVPLSTVNSSFIVSMTLVGAIDYLSGTTFISHGPVTYFANVTQTIALTAGSAPQPYSFTVTPAVTTFTSGAPTNTPVPIRRATWGSGIGSGLSGPGANTPGNVITIFGEGAFESGPVLPFPPTLVVGATVILSGFVNPFPQGFGITGQGGSSQGGPAIPVNISGTYIVTNVTTAIVGGNQHNPVFTVTAPIIGGATRSYDWGSTVNPPDSGWFFSAPLAPTSSNPLLTAVVYTTVNDPVSLVFYSKGTTAGSSTVSLGAGTLTSSTTGTVGGQTVYFKTFTLQFIPTPLPSGPTQLLGYIAEDTTTTLSTTYFSTSVYTFPA